MLNLQSLNFSLSVNVYLVLLFSIMENECIVPGMLCTFLVNRCILSHFSERVIIWHKTIMKLFPSQSLEPLVPNFLNARSKLGHHPVALFPLGERARIYWGKLDSLPRKEFNLGLYPGNAL